MSELERLQEAVKGDKELQKKFEAAKQAAKDSGAANDEEVFINAAKSFGYTITEADLDKQLAEVQEMSPEDLAMVSGGVNGGIRVDEFDHDQLCVFLWHCYTATLHTPCSAKEVNCWKDYDCLWNYKHA